MINRRATVTNFLGPLARASRGLSIVGAHHIPAKGSVLLVSLGPLDITAVRSHLSRPVVAVLSERSQARDLALASVWPDLLAAASPDVEVHRKALQELAHGHVVLTDTTVVEVGYLALASGARVIPIALHGTRLFISPDNVTLAPEFAHDSVLEPALIRAQSERIRQSVADHDLVTRDRVSGMMAP